MEQIPSSRVITRLLWNPKVNYYVHKGLPLVSTLNQMHSVHTSPPHFPKIHCNILPSTPRSSKRSLPFMFSDQNIICISHLPHACYTSPISSSLFDHPNNIQWSAQLMKLLITQYSSPSRHFLPLRSKYSPQHPVLKHPQSMLLP